MRRLGACAVALTLVLLGAGCSDDPKPRFEPTDSPSPSASETTEPPEPEAWEVRSKAGAVAFAEHWVDALNEAQSTGDTEALKALSAADCESCSALTEQLEGLYGAGGSMETDGWRVLTSAAPLPGPLENETEVILRVDRSPQKVETGDGDVERFPGGRTTYKAVVGWRDDAWSMKSLGRFA